MARSLCISRRSAASGIAATGLLAGMGRPSILRAQSGPLKVGVILPRSGAQALVGQSCQRGADLAPRVIKELNGVDIAIVSADTESNVEVARLRAEGLIQQG